MSRCIVVVLAFVSGSTRGDSLGFGSPSGGSLGFGASSPFYCHWFMCLGSCLMDGNDLCIITICLVVYLCV